MFHTFIILSWIIDTRSGKVEKDKCVWFYLSDICLMSLLLRLTFPLSSLRRRKDPPHGLVDLSHRVQHHTGRHHYLLLLQVKTTLKSRFIGNFSFQAALGVFSCQMDPDWSCFAGISVRSLVLGTASAWSRMRPTATLENPWRTW